MAKNEINTSAPYGWFLAGTHPKQYEATLDTAIFHSGTRSCRVACVAKKASGWTTLMQNMGPGPYLGKRLRMVFWTRTEDVGYVQGWMRVDGKGSKTPLAFENMCNRRLKGTTDWTRQEIVLDVDEESTNIGFGVIFGGTGTMWVDDIAFEIVDKSVPVTCCPCGQNSRQQAPVNLNFESDETA